jgi:hemerythrin-like metal-binding protein
MALQWDESLILGFDEIDNQHKSIFEQFEKLSEAVQQGKSKDIIAELAVFLFEYTHVHFSTEDRIMVKYGYPDIGVQREEHGAFTRDANELKEKIVAEGATRQVAIETTGILLRWIINHIKKHDKEMVTFIRGVIASGQE